MTQTVIEPADEVRAGSSPDAATYSHDIVRIEDLHIAIDMKGVDLEVIRGASFRIPAGKTVALVCEAVTETSSVPGK